MKRAAVLGLGSFGEVVATELARHGAEVLAIDHDEQVVERIKDKVATAIVCEAIDEDLLSNFGVGPTYDVVVIAMGNAFEAAQLALLAAQATGVRKIIVRATTPQRMEIMRRLGATLVINPEESTGRRVAAELTRGDIARAIDLGEGMQLLDMPVPASIVGRSLVDLDLRRKWKLNLVAIKVREQTKTESGTEESVRIENVPTPDRVFTAKDTLVLIGAATDLDAFFDEHHAP